MTPYPSLDAYKCMLKVVFGTIMTKNKMNFRKTNAFTETYKIEHFQATEVGEKYFEMVFLWILFDSIYIALIWS